VAAGGPLENVVPSSESTLWNPASGFSHLTVSPMRTVTVWGLKLLVRLSRVTTVVAAWAPVAASPAARVRSATRE